jgi:hypothetical protein
MPRSPEVKKIIRFHQPSFLALKLKSAFSQIICLYKRLFRVIRKRYVYFWSISFFNNSQRRKLHLKFRNRHEQVRERHF